MSTHETTDARTWWRRPGLDIRDGRLTIAGRDAETLARTHGTPLYVHDHERVAEQARALEGALRGRGLEPRVRLALKAQREPALLSFLRRAVPFVGMDVCSPGEVEWALAHGWGPAEISYTGTNLSDRDLDRILPTGVHVNVDLLTQLDRVGRNAPGGRVGIRVNPRIGASKAGGGQTFYTGERPTKFGIFPEQLDEALAVAARHRLEIDTVHFHVGDGYLTEGLAEFDESVRRVATVVGRLLEAGHPIAEVNTGGGLGVPETPQDRPLDLDRWASICATHLSRFGVAVGTEPGDFLVKDAVVHLAEVVTVEERDGVRFVGLDTGWNVMCEHFVYGAVLDLVSCRDVLGEPTRPTTVGGNINEGNDLFGEGVPLPDVREGDVIAALHVGSYNGSMTSVHCLREPARVVAFDDRL
ncbi:MAG TPA: diaminopimelate decarboxylase [Actinomycetota bacterium]|nr:diaminopimelate decarboxylase [Actinomycetota bacterium]